MPLDHDIFIICYLHNLRIVTEYEDNNFKIYVENVAFPVLLKLKLCKEIGIICLENNEYMYAPFLTYYRNDVL